MTDHAAAPASERPLPPLPEPAETALVQGYAMQGGEYRTLSLDYEEWTARYSVRHMRAYVLADRAASTPLAVRMLSEDEKFAIATNALGYGVLSEPDCNLTYGVIEAAIRKFCEVNGIVPLAPQDTGGK